MSGGYEIKDGQIVPEPRGQFEYGERYVRCGLCGALRPAESLKIDKCAGNLPECELQKTQQVVCKDMSWCVKNGG